MKRENTAGGEERERGNIKWKKMQRLDKVNRERMMNGRRMKNAGREIDALKMCCNSERCTNLLLFLNSFWETSVRWRRI